MNLIFYITVQLLNLKKGAKFRFSGLQAFNNQLCNPGSCLFMISSIKNMEGVMKRIEEPVSLYIFVNGKKEIIQEKLLLAYHSQTSKIEAVGTAAEQYLTAPNSQIVVCSPIKQGYIDDYSVFEKAIRYFIQETIGKKLLFSKPKIKVCLPEGIYFSEVNKKAYMDALYQAGAKQVILSEEIFEEAVCNNTQDITVILGIKIEDKEMYIQGQLQRIKEYAEKNTISRDAVMQLLEDVYKK